MRFGSKGVLATAIALTAGLALVGCSTAGPEPAGSAAPTAGSADVDGARAAIAELLEAPSQFPITTPLETSVAGMKVAYLDCGTPICAMGWDSSAAAAEAIGVELVRVDATIGADTIATAFDTVEAGGFDGVINVALPHALAEAGLVRMKELGIPVVGGGVVNGDPELYGGLIMSNTFFGWIGEVFGAWVVAEFGDAANTVFYLVPELELTQIVYEGFESTYREFCPECTLRTADIPIASLGSTSATVAVDDLLAHPDTTVAAFSTAEAAIGLPAAMASAGLSNVAVVGNAPTGDALRQIRDGEMVGGTAYDFVYYQWVMHDMLARLMTGQPLDPNEIADIIPSQILLQGTVTDELVNSGAWAPFPMGEFEQLWADAK